VGTAFFVGANRWSAGVRPERVLQESAGAEKVIRKNHLTTGKEKNSEGRSPGALGAEKGSQGRWVADAVERVAKP
jgi:hypothetical protein